MAVEVMFYHLGARPVERVLPLLLEKTMDRGWKAVVCTGLPERVSALDELLWTYNDESFLPHATDAESDLADEAIVITANAANPNKAECCFLLDGAAFPTDASQFQRIVLMFDDADEELKQAARAQWKTIKAGGFEASYWQPDENGRWEKKA